MAQARDVGRIVCDGASGSSHHITVLPALSEGPRRDWSTSQGRCWSLAGSTRDRGHSIGQRSAWSVEPPQMQWFDSVDGFDPSVVGVLTLDGPANGWIGDDEGNWVMSINDDA